MHLLQHPPFCAILAACRSPPYRQALEELAASVGEATAGASVGEATTGCEEPATLPSEPEPALDPELAAIEVRQPSAPPAQHTRPGWKDAQVHSQG